MLQEKSFLERLGIYFIIFLVISVLFEIGLLVYGYVNADEVECNLLWCSFKTSTKETIQTYDCFVNGKRVNCSSYKPFIWKPEQWCYNGTCEVGGVVSPEEFFECVERKGVENCTNYN